MRVAPLQSTGLRAGLRGPQLLATTTKHSEQRPSDRKIRGASSCPWPFSGCLLTNRWVVPAAADPRDASRHSS